LRKTCKSNVKDYDPKHLLGFVIYDLSTLQEAFEIRKKKVSKYSKLMGLFSILSWIGFFISDISSYAAIVCSPLCAISIICTFVFYGKLSYWKKLGDDAYADLVMRPAIDKELPGARYIYDCHIDSDSLFKINALKPGNRVSGTAHISYHGLPENNYEDSFEFSNMTVKHETGSGKNRHVSTYFIGNVINMKLSRDIHGTVRIITSEKGLFGKESIGSFVKKKSNESKIDVENIEFNESFEVYAANEIEGYLIVNPYVMERLFKLKEHCKKYSITIVGDTLCVCLYSNKYLFQTPNKIKKEDLSYDSTLGESKVLKEIVQIGRDISTYISGNIV